MKSRRPRFCFKSFDEMKALLDAKAVSFPDYPPPLPVQHEPAPTPEIEEKLFQEAMDGVTPILKDNYVERAIPLRPPERPTVREDREPILKLGDLVNYGTGFEVADTPEYIEGTMYQVDPEVARRLHSGEYSIQAYVDLHRYKVTDAEEAFERFLKWAVTAGKTGVLIIHGRGLSSPSEPILKNKVVEWLTRGPWRKWIVAYSSARSCDGGAGATYVLLRNRPISKRFKRPIKPKAGDPSQKGSPMDHHRERIGE